MKRSWLAGLLSGQPHFIVGGADNPYMFRWYVLPRNRFLNIYLHKFLRDDEDRALHDHPWWFLSLMLKGGYEEVTGSGKIRRNRFSLAFRSALHRHRVVLLRDGQSNPIPCWTLVITGRKKRVWGFWCPKGFVAWFDFVEPDDVGAVGRGCDQ